MAVLGYYFLGKAKYKIMVYYCFFILFLAEAFFINLIRQQLQKNKSAITDKNWNVFFIVLSLLQLVLLYSFRALPDDNRLDLYRYVMYFGSMSDGGNSFLEPGFRYYNYICSFLGDSTPYILFVFSFPTISIIMWFIYKHSRNVYLSVYIYYGFIFYFFLFNGLRQCMAISIGLIAYHFIDKKKWIIALCFILLAYSFHSSALILLILYAVKFIDVQINLRYFILLMIICCILAVIGKYLIIPITMLIAKGYSGYFMMDGYGNEGNIANPIMYLFIMLLVCFLYRKQDESNTFFIKVLSIGVMLYALSIQVQVLNRMAYYFTIVVICVLPNLLSQIKNVNLRFWAIVGCYTAITIYGGILVLNNAHGILPYQLGI